MPKPSHSQPSRHAAKKPAANGLSRARILAKAAKGGKPSVGRSLSKRPTGRLQKVAGRAAAKLPARKAPASPPVRRARAASASAAAPKPVPAGPSPHELAVEAFERGFQALQQRQFGRAAQFLATVLKDYPDEKEMQERARVYLSICERQQASPAQHPRSLEERINAATVALNRGAVGEGLALLRKLESDHGDHDHVQYMLCVAFTGVGDLPHALEHLKQAVALNHENRYLATQDVDLDPLRQDPGFAAALETSAGKPAKVAARKR